MDLYYRYKIMCRYKQIIQNNLQMQCIYFFLILAFISLFTSLQ